ncbi:MAG: hypothetical protein OXH00_02790 [Candidatus Poribacteria bacterium]|nr:hypothetical protein [Candidatus Poribacteria bacterium]
MPRAHSTVGHLESVGFKVCRLIREDRIRIYKGADYRDDLHAYFKEMRNEGFGDHYENFLRNENLLIKHIAAFNFGYAKILKHVSESEHPTLVISSDVYIGRSYRTLAKRWNMLVDAVGLENINVAMLYHKNNGNQPTEDINDIWVRGSLGNGDTANIWTPHGAKHYLNLKSDRHIETFLGNNQMAGIYTHRKQCIWFSWARWIDNGDINHQKVEYQQAKDFADGYKL